MSNPKQLWDSMKSITNMQSSQKYVSTSDDLQKANDLNNFYLRFEKCSQTPANSLSDLGTSGVFKEKLLIDANQINYYFKHISPNKSAGPDGISAYILKNFADELTPVWLPIFQQSLDTGSVPSLWKRAVIVPAPKIARPVVNNDFRPIALTSVIMKCFEKCIVSMLKAEVANNLDPLQFAYRQGRGTEDAIISIMHLILKHLENNKAYARLLFIDFSSAFNTIQTPLLISKMEQLSVNPAIIKWYSSFLTDRTQCVKVNNCLSEQRKISTGVPQGCVSSPILFTLFTNECSSKHSKNYIFKYSDDTAILSLLDVDDNIGDVYLPEISQFVQWCDKNDLIINIKKTEEIIFDPKGIGDHHQVVIHNQNITQTQTFKYLGVYIDKSLTWKTHMEWICTRLHQRLYFLRRLHFYGVNKKIMMLFYKAVLESIVKYGVTVWFGNLSIQLKSKLAHLVLTALKIVGHEESLNLQQLFENSTL